MLESATSTSKVLRVSANSPCKSVAGAIAAIIREDGFAEVQAIGAGAVNQTVKSLAIARKYLQDDEIEISCIPVFTEVSINGEERTAVRFQVKETARV